MVSIKSAAGWGLAAKAVGETSSSCSFACKSDEMSIAAADGRSLGLSFSMEPITLVSACEYLLGMAGYRPLRMLRFNSGKLLPVNGGRNAASCVKKTYKRVISSNDGGNEG